MAQPNNSNENENLVELVSNEDSNVGREEQDESGSDNKGTITMVLDGIYSYMPIDKTAPAARFADADWFLHAETAPDCFGKPYLFGLVLRHESISKLNLWYGEMEITCKLHSRRENVEPFVRRYSTIINFYTPQCNLNNFIEYSKLCDQESPYVKDYSALLEANIVVKKRVFSPVQSSMFDFTRPDGQHSDGVLIVDGIRLHILKSYLALHSRVFAAMFNSDFRERQMDEIPLKDVILEEFIELLYVIYPSYKPVDANNVGFLMKLGDQFDMPSVLTACEKYLLRTTDFTTTTKLIWGDKYHFSLLQRACVESLKTTDEIMHLRKSSEYSSLSETSKVALFDRLTSFLQR